MSTLLHLTSFALVKAGIALSLCDWKETDTVKQPRCGVLKHSDLKRLNPDRVNPWMMSVDTAVVVTVAVAVRDDAPSVPQHYHTADHY